MNAPETKRHGDWMQTFTGRRFWPLDPHPEDVVIEDIAHALSMQCRYGGHTMVFYSVAEHSVHLSYAVTPENALWALMHDAAEAYVSDVIRPLKNHLGGFHIIERRVMQAICARFGLAGDEPDEVREKDFRIIGDERALLSNCEVEWTNPPEPLGITRYEFSPPDEKWGWSPRSAEVAFLTRFKELTREADERATMTWAARYDLLHSAYGRQPTYAELLEAAKAHTMTPAENAEQAEAFARANVAIDKGDAA